MAVASGQYGLIQADGSTLVECTGWSFNRSAAEHAYASCSTGGFKKRIAGTKDGGGELRGVLDVADPIENYIVEGDLVTLKLYYTATLHHLVPAMITTLDEEADIEEGDILRWTANFGINGAWTANQS